MNKNTINATIEFDFKGAHHAPFIEFDLDDWARKSEGQLPDFVNHIAKNNGIGTFSYELEVMETVPVTFSEPKGLAIDFLDKENQSFDFDGFYQAWQEAFVFEQLNAICQTTFKHSLDKESDLYQALSKAYFLGQKA